MSEKKKLPIALSLRLLSLFIGFALIFGFLIFPYDDLSDLLSSQISKQTNGSVYLQFDKLSLNPLPTPSVQLDNVQVVTQRFPEIKIKKVSVTPSLISMITLNPGFSLSAKDLLKGNLDFKLSSGGKTKAGTPLQKVSVDIEHLDLGEVKKILQLAFKIKGQLDLEATAKMDPNLSEQPEAEFEAGSKNLNLPSQTFPLRGFGSITFPKFSFKHFNLKGRPVDSKMNLEELELGKGTDTLKLKLKGNIDLQFQKTPAGPKPKLLGYDLRVELYVHDSLKASMFYLATIADHKVKGKPGKYMFRAKATNMSSLPKLSSIQKL